jgi:hypothetical protein
MGLLKMGDPQVTISSTKLIVHDLHFLGGSPIETFSLDELSSCPNSHLGLGGWTFCLTKAADF